MFSSSDGEVLSSSSLFSSSDDEEGVSKPVGSSEDSRSLFRETAESDELDGALLTVSSSLSRARLPTCVCRPLMYSM